ncbi:hypothetical protein MMC06_001135 [Schaereria dolodes]|nr:hypothetical protein [Schaereria dolodes]
MASRIFVHTLRAFTKPIATNIPIQQPRSFQTASRLLDAATTSAALPSRKPVGAFRGGLFGFLAGTTLAGSMMYYYILDEYKVSNELLTEDIYALQAAVQRIHSYVTTLEEKVDAMQKRK